MSCLPLKLPPARTVWKSLTSKLQSKLHKLQGSKAIKKPRNRLKKTIGGGVWPSLLSGQRFKRKKRLAIHSYRQQYVFEKKTASVYVDKLFKEPAQVEQCPPRTKSSIKLLDQQAGGSLAEKPLSADDMWESLALASPLMRGVDERADEFIARFRAEMEVQETLARNL
jgi:hypothetical protein